MALTNEQIDEIAGPADYFDRRVFARAIESEVRKDDEALIRQLVDALEGYRRNHNDTQPCDAERAGRARLEIASLQARIKTMAEEHADELTVAHLDGRMRAAQEGKKP